MRSSVGNSAVYNDDCILLLQHSKPAHKEAKQFLLWKGRGQGSSLDFSDQSKYKTGVHVCLFDLRFRLEILRMKGAASTLVISPKKNQVCSFVCLFDLGFRLARSMPRQQLVL